MRHVAKRDKQGIYTICVEKTMRETFLEINVKMEG